MDPLPTSSVDPVRDPPSTADLFRDLLNQRRYLRNVTSDTLDWYQTAFKALQRVSQGPAPPLTKSSLQAFVVALRQRNVKPVSVNTYLKALNAFCRWLHEEGHHPERLKVPLLNVEKRVGEARAPDADGRPDAGAGVPEAEGFRARASTCQ